MDSRKRTARIAGLALALLKVHQNGVSIVGSFWGLWLFPFGVLAIQSRFIPRTLGALLIVSGCSYLIETFVVLVAPQHREVLAGILTLPTRGSELSEWRRRPPAHGALVVGRATLSLLFRHLLLRDRA